MDESFGKEYKLCSQKVIEQIFRADLKVKQFPFVLHYSFHTLPTTKSFQAVISAPKRIFRKAHERNRIKRLMKEVLRKQKSSLENELLAQNKQLALFLIYTSKEELEYKVLKAKMEHLLQKLILVIKESSEENQVKLTF